MRVEGLPVYLLLQEQLLRLEEPVMEPSFLPQLLHQSLQPMRLKARFQLQR